MAIAATVRWPRPPQVKAERESASSRKRTAKCQLKTLHQYTPSCRFGSKINVILIKALFNISRDYVQSSADTVPERSLGD
jgi:hypothetical protein